GAIIKQIKQQLVQDHGICNIRDVELIKTDQLVLVADDSRHLVQRIALAAQRLQLMVHTAHEFMKMDSRLLFDLNRHEKRIHQKTFATAYATPHINTTRRLGLAEKTPEGLTQLLLIGNQFVSKHLQACDGPLL